MLLTYVRIDTRRQFYTFLFSSQDLIEQRVVRHCGDVDRRRYLLLAVGEVEILLHVLDADLAVGGQDCEPLIVYNLGGLRLQFSTLFDVVDGPVFFFATKAVASSMTRITLLMRAASF